MSKFTKSIKAFQFLKQKAIIAALGLILFSAHTVVAQTTVADIIINSPDHTTLEAAVVSAGLVETLKGAGPFTVFAPTDAAFAALPAGTVAALLADIPALTNILTYHVVGAKAMSSSLSNGQKIVTVQGKKVTVTINGDGVFINNAKVTVVDLVADNGVVHVIDAVLIPSALPATVVDIIVNSPVHNTLEAAVVAAGLVPTLQGDGPFTVFAPTDAAFAALPAGTVEALLADIPTLTKILSYHVVGTKAMSSSLTNGQEMTTVLGKDIKVTINGAGVFINNAKVTVANLEADNGVVHVIDAVLIPAADVNVTETQSLGKVLTDAYGRTLYFFTKDAKGTSMCTDGCLNNWPVFYSAGMEFGAGLNASDFASINRGNGVMQNTYKGWPLYYFVNDTLPGSMKGDGVIGKWFVAKPDYTLMISDNQLTGLNAINYKGDYTPGDEVIQYFTDDKGLTLYTFKNDKRNTNKFTNPDFSNNGVWPIYEESEIVLPSVLNKSDFGIINVYGKNQLTFKGWPLYYFGQDMMVRGNNKGVSFPSPGIWPVPVKNMMMAPIPATVVDIIVNSPDHTTLEAAVVAAGLVETLQGTGPFTVFAPTDAAFAALPAGTVEALLADIPALTNILTYHVVGAKAMSSSLSNGQKIVTVQGKKVTVTINGDGVFINNAKVTVADIEAENGVVHVINAVLIPSTLPATVVDIIANSADHTTLEAAVVAAGLVETLKGDGPFTVFAPTDAAFAALPAGTVEALLADIPALTNILTYHVVGAKAMSSSLSNGQKIVTVQGKEITVTINVDGVFINNAKVTVTNLEADNGVVHVIDAVLMPPLDKAAFPIDFETQTDATWSVFANGAGAEDDFMVIPNPDKTGINTSANVLKFKVNAGAETYAGAFSDSYAPVEFTEKSHVVTMMVWKSVISPVGFKVEGSTNGGPVTEVKVSNTLINQWEKITFDFSAIIGYSYNRIDIFPDFPDTRTSGTTVYLDNIVKEIVLPATVVDIIVNSADHTTLEAAVVTAGLVETLQGPGPFTVFAPTDAAFAALPAGTVEALLADIPALTDILLYHVVGTKAMSSDLSNGQKIVTLQGQEVTVTINADGVFINNAKVTVANLEAENGVVHVIDAVLIPETTTAVADRDKAGSAIKIYPNPASSNIKIDLKPLSDNTLISYVRITNMVGKVLVDVPVKESQFSYNVDNLAPGMYFVSVKQNNKVKTEKLIVK